MIIKDLSSLEIHKMSKEQYRREYEAGNIDDTAIYLVPDEDDTPDSPGEITQSSMHIVKMTYEYDDDGEPIYSFADDYEYNWDTIVEAAQNDQLVICSVRDGEYVSTYILSNLWTDDGYMEFLRVVYHDIECLTITADGDIYIMRIEDT